MAAARRAKSGVTRRELLNGEQSACKGQKICAEVPGGRPAKLTATDERWLVHMVTKGEVDNAAQAA
jgi:hypothetical protein